MKRNGFYIIEFNGVTEQYPVDAFEQAGEGYL